MADSATIDYYTRAARTYGDFTESFGASTELDRFCALLPAGAAVLDLGCGPGWAAAVFRDRGFETEAVDAVPAFADEARRRFDLPVRIARFDQIADRSRFDGIWASFSLLHDSRAAMPGHLDRLGKALVPGGLLYLGLKEGIGEERDLLGRAYTYFEAAEIDGMLKRAGFTGTETSRSREKGMTGRTEPCLHIFARRN